MRPLRAPIPVNRDLLRVNLSSNDECYTYLLADNKITERSFSYRRGVCRGVPGGHRVVDKMPSGGGWEEITQEARMCAKRETIVWWPPRTPALPWDAESG